MNKTFEAFRESCRAIRVNLSQQQQAIAVLRGQYRKAGEPQLLTATERLNLRSLLEAAQQHIETARVCTEAAVVAHRRGQGPLGYLLDRVEPKQSPAPQVEAKPDRNGRYSIFNTKFSGSFDFVDGRVSNPDESITFMAGFTGGNLVRFAKQFGCTLKTPGLVDDPRPAPPIDKETGAAMDAAQEECRCLRCCTRRVGQ